MPKISRTSVFTASCIAGLVLLVAGDQQLPSALKQTLRTAFGGAAKPDGATVRVHVFDAHGQLIGPIDSPHWNLTDGEWKERLTPEQYRVSRRKGTEPAFCGMLLDNKEEGIYACVGCRLPLFSSDSKYHSGTGWPSFLQPIAPGNVEEIKRIGGRTVGEEILCARCGGHLGHVFNDGPEPTGHRFCLNSAALTFTPIDQAASLADPASDPKSAQSTPTSAGQPADISTKTKVTAVFAGGCFWCTEAAFEQLRGVIDVESGYAGGTAETASYHAVATGATGHAEAIRVTYDPVQISYDQLLNIFFEAHDPTQLNRQEADVGTQYRSAIFYADDAQKQAAEAKIRKLTAAAPFAHFWRPIVTTLEPLKAFYAAEIDHQDYAAIHPADRYIQVRALPKVCKVREKHAELMKPQD